MIAAIMTLHHDDGDIVGACLDHLEAEGIDQVLIAATDPFLKELCRSGVIVYPDHDEVHRQELWQNRLIDQAFKMGAEWIVPVDADEFWVTISGTTIGDLLCDEDLLVVKHYAKVWRHFDGASKEAEPCGFSKVTFRPRDGMFLRMGGHDVYLPAADGETTLEVWDDLEIRELQFRDEDHFVAKVKRQLSRLDPNRPPKTAEHYTRLEGFSEDELRQEYRRLASVPMVVDPIPTRVSSSR